jgi:carboxypeptidase D
MTKIIPKIKCNAPKRGRLGIVPVLFIVLFLVFLVSSHRAFAGFSDRTPHEITLSAPSDLNLLVTLGTDIDRVTGNLVSAYLSPEERKLLTSLLFQVRAVPDREREAHLLYYGKKSKAAETLYYPTYSELTLLLEDFRKTWPGICRVESAGLSVQGRNLWAVTISGHPDQREAEPAVTLVSTLHGNEPVGTVLLVALIRYLVEGYDTDPRVKALVDRHEIRILPLANPDGYEEGDRYNAQGLDINRNFPDPSEGATDTFNSREGRAPETLALMDWILERPAAVSLNLHTGFLVVNYPLDYTDDVSPDDALFQHLSLAYASNCPAMAASPYPGGIVRGSVWYIITGGLQDWAYVGGGELHVTVELNTEKYPAPSGLAALWASNREALLAWLETADKGIGGRVLDSDTGLPVAAWVRIQGNGHLVFTDAVTGHYLRVLLPGDYTLTAGAPGYMSRTFENISVTGGSISVRDVLLEKGDDPLNGGAVMSNWPVRENSDEEAEPPSGSGGGGCFIGATY